jgi:hypothetical protein
MILHSYLETAKGNSEISQNIIDFKLTKALNHPAIEEIRGFDANS